MECSEDSVGWDIQFYRGILGMVSLDYRVDLLIVDGTDKANLIIETEFLVKNDDLSVRCNPGDSKSLAPILNLINKRVTSVSINKSGHIELFFSEHGSIEVGPSSSYEAWQLGISSGLLLVCPPEGDVVVFRKGNSVST